MTVQGRKPGQQNEIDEISQRVTIVSTTAELLAITAQARGKYDEYQYIDAQTGLLWLWSRTSVAAAWPGLVVVPNDGVGRYLALNQTQFIQTGTVTLGAGGTATVNTARITAQSLIYPVVAQVGAGAIVGFVALAQSALVVGAPGSFTLTAVDGNGAPIVAARCVVNYLIVG